MAEEALASREIPVAKLAEGAESNGIPVKIIEECKTEEKRKDEETAMEGEFVKVEKESLDVKDRSHTPEIDSDAAARLKEEHARAATSEHKDETTKSREIDLSAATSPSKRKSKKKPEATSAPASDAQIQTAEASLGLNLKFVLGVALVSIIFGIILGKRY
ncbi:hypothetical protein SASPL_132352 [Salvia splendens]|uniref:Uncharacterized protein n=1 Tax=Salvia splendens TaxID=180675 RepID=A0A8X8X3E4_SALSN|nr:hypothetical protein SASPL_132352 [Salvia splendens]